MKSTSTWNDTLSIGIPLLDLQHKQLIDQMDRLLEAIVVKKETQELKSILSFLNMYVNNHFSYEQSCMELHKCPVACQNQAAHARFLKILQEVNQKIDQKESLNLISVRIKKELLDWFVSHIKSIDIRLTPCVKK
ncbi:hemerythrin-like metal-binding domain protein [Lyngbya aestuarii BL J]|uniref:Hemerythrin-like metal-binding domain protein n=1 Tax=Lyngbya aestuarii BL J TaxID=1348334 RepID=U7QQA9_9CYAN|nr:hemerythrin family protein [Lyngbya aestuarii]ERT09305.1 hemerythrin-like metal-binding domain protein [Lyngbya aestuarii BL J]